MSNYKKRSPTEPYADLAAKIRKVRMRQNLTQTELAEAAGVCPSYICHIESGRRLPGLPMLMKVAAHLGHEVIIKIAKL